MILNTTDSIIAALSDVPSQVVSLVPSVTDTLISMGLSSLVVGITDYCPHLGPKKTKRVGGTKTTDVDAVLDLTPDLVIANKEENSRDKIEALESAGLRIWLTFPKNVLDVIHDLRTTARIFGISREWTPRIDTLERAYEIGKLAMEGQSGIRFFCPIWLAEDERVFTTIGEDTYVDDILKVCGGTNVFGNDTQEDHEPGDDEVESLQEVENERYPRVGISEVNDTAPEIILLPSEPYPFSPSDFDHLMTLFADTPAVRERHVYFIDGRLITWHGTRTARALAELPVLFGRQPPHHSVRN